MQVATLFREAATLLGATMEAPEGTAMKMSNYSDNNMMKQEVHDDGYETSGDLELRAQGNVPKLMGQIHQHQQSPHPPHPHQQHQIHQPHQQHQPHQPHQPSQHQQHQPNQPLQHQQHQPLPQHQSHPQHQPHQQHPLHPHAFMHLLPHEHHPHPNNCIKFELPEDPYSFVDETQTQCPPGMLQQAPKKRGRKKKVRPEEEGMMYSTNPLLGNMALKPTKDGTIKVYKERKKHDRFNGMPEEEVSKRTLPDHLTPNLDIVIIGINPGLFAAYKGHHYAGPGNHFWKCLYLSGLTPEPMTADDDYKLLKNGIGFTNMVERATKGSADLTRKEIKEGSQILLEKLQKFKPKIAVFNGKLIFEVFSGKKDFCFGRQPELVDGTNTYMWVMPSSSARCAQLPRAADKVPFYSALKKFRDYLNGVGPELDENEIVFTYSKLKTFFEPDVKEEPKDGQLYYSYNNQLENGILNDDEGEPLRKKKRGRPKKVKNENGEEVKKEVVPKVMKPISEDDKCSIDGAPKKKRGRPKKVKTSAALDSNGISHSEHSNPSTHMSSCFSPPIQSPMNLPPLYPGQPPTIPALMSQPASQSPLVYHPYSQSPQAPSFTHSDLSSEISAAISSEHIQSPGPASPSLGPPDFEPPASMPEEPSKSPPPSTPNTIPEESRMECHFSSPAPAKEKTSEINYQNYEDFSGDSENMTIVRYPHPQRPRVDYQHIVKPNLNQDVASKSLSGLESLVDQIPNIGEGEQMNEHVPAGQYAEDSYLSEYSRMYPPPAAAAAAATTQQSQASMNFSVSSLTNNSSLDAFSVSHNYNSSYPNLMGPPHPHLMDSSSSSLFNPLVDRTCRLGGSSMNSVGMPYPYNQYSSPGFSYPTPHNIHVPSPSFPYPAPYPSASYSQTGYHNIGYGSF